MQLNQSTPQLIITRDRLQIERSSTDMAALCFTLLLLTVIPIGDTALLDTVTPNKAVGRTPPDQIAIPGSDVMDDLPNPEAGTITGQTELRC